MKIRLFTHSGYTMVYLQDVKNDFVDMEFFDTWNSDHSPGKRAKKMALVDMEDGPRKFFEQVIEDGGTL